MVAVISLPFTLFRGSAPIRAASAAEHGNARLSPRGGLLIPKMKHTQLQRRFAVLKTGLATEYTQRTHGGYGNMMVKLFKDDEANERWDIFPVLDGDFSFMDQYDAYDAYVVTGSAADAHAQDTWILRLCDAITFLHNHNKRILGICFGHQILARALGGKTVRADVGWELGLKCINLDSTSIYRLYGFTISSTLHVIESHRDQVTLVPPDALILATSERTEIEMFALGENVLAMQWHPEFTKDVILDIIESRFSRKTISAEVANEATKSLEERHVDIEPIKQLCKLFLKGKLQSYSSCT